MKGKILGAGAISGEDGVRYYYDDKELKNLKDGQKLEGCEVDFDVKGGKAVGVYIIKSGGFNADFSKVGSNVSASLEKVNLPKFDSPHIFWDLNETKANLFRPNIHSVKFWLLLFLILNIFVVLNLFPSVTTGVRMEFLSIMGWIFNFAVVLVLIWVSLCLGTLAKTQSLFKYITIAFLAFVSASWFGTKYAEWVDKWRVFVGNLLDFPFDLKPEIIARELPAIPYFKLIIFAFCLVIIIICIVKWLKLSSKIAEQKAYKWASYLFIIYAICMMLLGSMAVIFTLGATSIDDAKYFDTLMDIMRNLTLSVYVVSALLVAWATLRFREIKQID